MPETTPEIPDKKPGQAYTILFCAHGRTMGADARADDTAGADATGRFPKPTFADACICCNQPALGQRHRYAPWSGRGYARDAIELPLCIECTDHAFAPLDPASLALLPLRSGALAALVGVWRDQPLLEHAGVALALLALLVFALWHLKASYRGTALHHEGIDIDARPGRLRIATKNRELVRTVVALNTSLVERVS